MLSGQHGQGAGFQTSGPTSPSRERALRFGSSAGAGGGGPGQPGPAGTGHITSSGAGGGGGGGKYRWISPSPSASGRDPITKSRHGSASSHDGENSAAVTPNDRSANQSGQATPNSSTSASDKKEKKDAASRDESKTLAPGEEPVVLGICAMDVKARSKPMREILTRVVEKQGDRVDIKIFGDIVIQEEDITHWPRVDILISFFSTDFPLSKAIEYTRLPDPTKPRLESINSLEMQSLLWDRRLVLCLLDHIGVPTPRRAEVSRDGGPKVDAHLKEILKKELGLVIPGLSGSDEEESVVIPPRWKASRDRSAAMGLLKDCKDVPRSSEVILREDGDAIIINGHVVEKPFVEKPVNGEDHNVYIYYRGGGGRKLFRKVGCGLYYGPTMRS